MPVRGIRAGAEDIVRPRFNNGIGRTINLLLPSEGFR